MHKFILINLLLSTLLFAYDKRSSYELQSSIMIGFDPLIGETDQELSLAGVGGVFDLLICLTEHSAIKGGWGGRAASYSRDLSVKYTISEWQYEYDGEGHRVGLGLSYYYDIISEASPKHYPVSPLFEDTLGYLISYHFFEKTHKQLDSASSDLKTGMLKGILFGLKYEYATFRDRAAAKRYPASFLSLSFGLVF